MPGTTMRAVVMIKKGPAAESLVYHDDWPMPVRKPKQVLVRIAAASVNAGEWKLRSGGAPFPLPVPRILGEDMAGVVVEAPEGCKFKTGDKVFASTGQALEWGQRAGTYAEYDSVDEETLCAIPPGLSFEEAAAVPMAAKTAWAALAPAMPLAGKRVLVHAGAGGVGTFAVQIAKAQGAHVTATCSTRNVGFVTQDLGADVALDYTQGPWEDGVSEPLDVVVDAIGGSYETASLRLLKRGGLLSALGASGPGVKRVSAWGLVTLLLNALARYWAGRLGLAPKYQLVMEPKEASQGLEQVAELITQGKVKVHLDKVYPLEQMVAAHEYSERGHTRGKVAISVAQL